LENLRKQYSTTVYGKQYNAMQCRKVREATEERTPKTVQWQDQRASVALAGAAGGARGSRTPKEGGVADSRSPMVAASGYGRLVGGP